MSMVKKNIAKRRAEEMKTILKPSPDEVKATEPSIQERIKQHAARMKTEREARAQRSKERAANMGTE